MMLPSVTIICLALGSSIASAIVLPLPTPKPTALARRDDAPAIPTFTFGPTSKYFPSKASNPEPSGTSLQIFPTGIYEKFPDDGITIALGPDLRGQVQDTISKKCANGGPTQECQNALASILQNTDMTTHTKRFVTMGVLFVASGVIAVVAFLLAHASPASTPSEVNFDAGDLSQIHSLGGANTFAAVTSGASAPPATVVYQPAPTATASEYITIETITADKDNHKAGSVVYHIPQHAAERIYDFMAMTGIGETQNVCKGQNLKRADTLDQCLQQIRRHAMDLADGGPSNLLQLAPQNFPRPPGPGQAIDFPVDHVAFGGIIVLIPVYRGIRQNTPNVVPNDQGWDPAILAKTAMAVTIAAHAAMFAGQSLLDIWIDKDDLVTDLTPDRLTCPKDLICTADECGGQEDGKALNLDISPICKQSKSYGCICEAVQVPHMILIEHDYMDEQYKWLEDLIKRASMPTLTPECSAGNNPLDGAADKARKQFSEWCKNHQDLKTPFHNGTSYDSSTASAFDFTIEWRDLKGQCKFDCDYIFSTFVDATECISDKGMQKYGEIKTECGTATYLGQTHNCAYITC